MKHLATPLFAGALLAVAPAASAVEDVTIPQNGTVSYGPETVDVGKIIFTYGGSASSPSKGWLNLNGTTMTAAGISTPGGTSGNQWILGWITVTNGASLACTNTTDTSIFGTMYGTQQGTIFVDHSSLSFAGTFGGGSSAHNYNRNPFSVCLVNGSTFASKSVTLRGWDSFAATDSVVRVNGSLTTGYRNSYGSNISGGWLTSTNLLSLVRSDTTVSGSMTLAQRLQTAGEVIGGKLVVGGDLSLVTEGWSPDANPYLGATLAISGGADVCVTGTVAIACQTPYTADMTVSSDSTFSAGALTVGSSGPGTFAADNMSFAVKNAFTVGKDAKARGTASVTNDTLSVGSLAVGSSGWGFLNARGSAIASAGAIAIGSGANVTGTVDVCEGTLSGTTLTVGSSGCGTLCATNAAVTASGAVAIGSAAGSTGVFDLGAGTLTAASLAVGDAGTGTLDARGADLAISGALTVGGASGTATVDARGATLTVGGAITIGANGVLDLGDGPVETTSLTGGAGTSTVRLDGNTITLTSNGGLFTGVTTVEGTAATVTIDTSGHDITLGNAPSATTPLHFTGGGRVSIASGVTLTNYTFDRSVHFTWADKGATITVSQLEEGTTVADAQNRSFAGNETLRFDITSGATRVVSGALGIGTLEKVGGGYLKLTNRDDYFGNVCLGAGTLAFGADLYDDMLANFVISNTAGEMVVVENATKQVGAFPAKDNFKGALVKRGAGELVLEHPGNASGYTYAPKAPLSGTAAFDRKKPLDFSDPSVLPTENFTALDVVEGKLTIRGTSAGRARLEFNAKITVGGPVKTCVAQPELVFDNLEMVNGGYSYFDLGPANVNGTSAIVSPRLTVVNSYVSLHTLRGNDCYGGGSNKDQCSYLVFSNSTLSAYALASNGGYNSGGASFVDYRFVDSSLRLTQFVLSGSSFRMTLENSLLDNGSYKTFTFNAYGSSTNTIVFSRGSQYYFNGTAYNLTNSGDLTKRQDWVFDDSQWLLDNTDNDRTYHVLDRVNVVCVMRGKGLVVKPGAGVTYVMNEPLTGEGGFVNGGAGTVVMTNDVAQYAGVTAVTNAAGTIDFDGGTLASAKFAGPGTFRNVSVGSLTIALSSNADGTRTDAPVLDDANGFALSGTATVDLGSSVLERPLEGNLTLTIATYTGGTPPDVSGWTLKKNAQVRKGTFTAADGKITCVPEFRRGFVLMLR